MISVNGYYDGKIIRPLEKLNAKKNQRIIITLLDEDIQPKNIATKKTAAGILAKYANVDLIPMEEGAWERAVENNENT